MANNYAKILELSNKNNMGLSNTIKRDYGIPLDYSSVQASYDAAVIYAATSTLAYVGQPIAVGDKLYVVSDKAFGKHIIGEGDNAATYDVYIKEVGVKPVGDNNSIIITDDGKISIHGFTTAPDATLPRKKADGTLEWVAVDAIVSGDGNTKTVIAAAEDSNITITPVYDEANDTYTYILDVTLPSAPEYTVVDDIVYDSASKKIYLVSGSEPIGTGFDASAFIKDGMIDSVELKDNELIIIWNTDAGKKAETKINLEHLIDLYTAGTGITVNGKVISIDNKYLDTIYAKQQTTLAGYGITDAYTKDQTNQAITAKISEIVGGETVADALNAYKVTNDREVWGDEFVSSHTTDGKYNPNYTGNSRIDAISSKVDSIEDGAEKNIIEVVKIAGAALEVSATDRSVNITTDALNVYNKTQIEVIKADIDKKIDDHIEKDFTPLAETVDKLTGSGEGSIQKIVTGAISSIPVATDQVIGLVKASDTVAVASDGTMSITKVSTDALVQGSCTLVLRGGSASS